MANHKIAVGMVGYGYWGPNLARNIHGLEGATLAALADLAEPRLADAQALYPMLRTTTNFGDLFADPAIDAIVIATPVRTHYALAAEALACGKHVLVEKPLAMTSAEARELAALADKCDRVLMVGHTFEYNPAVWKIKELIDKGELGSIYYLYSNRVNLGKVQRDINVLWSIAPHDLSIMIYLLGATPLQVSAQGGTYLNDGVEDVVFITLLFPNEVRAHIHVSWLDPVKVRRMTIVGSKKMVVYDDVDNEARLRIYDKGVYRKSTENYGEFQLKLHSGNVLIPQIEMSEPLRNECAHFIECIRTHRQPRTNALNGLRVVQVLEAAQQSLKTGGSWIALSD